MMEESNRFRSAMRGFHRQDVLNYMSKREEEVKLELDALKEELEAEKRLRGEAQARVEVLDVMVHDLEERESSLSDELKVAKSALEITTSSYDEAAGELVSLRKSVAEIGEKALAYERLKDRTAAIELDAHGRASSVIAQAKAEVEQIREDALVWVNDIVGQYKKLRSSLEDGFSSATREMEAVCDVFGHISQEFGQKGDTLSHIVDRIEALDEVEEEELFAD